MEFVIGYVDLLSCSSVRDEFLDFFNLLRYHFREEQSISKLIELFKKAKQFVKAGGGDISLEKKFVNFLKEKKFSKIQEDNEAILQEIFQLLFYLETQKKLELGLETEKKKAK